MLSDNELLLLDDGNNRPDCESPYADHCFTRAIKYHLDFETKEVSVLWQFEYKAEIASGNTTLADAEAKDLFVFDGGSVTFDNSSGHYFPAFTVTQSGIEYGNWAFVFEVDHKMQIQARPSHLVSSRCASSRLAALTRLLDARACCF